MKIINELPPIWDKINAAGMRPNPKTVVFTYGDTLYMPGGGEIIDHLMKHEETHSKQQGDDPDAWWRRYIDDIYFRVEQEIQAYAKQFAFICVKTKDRNKRSDILSRLARDLSGPLYGNVISHQDAIKKIKQRSNVTS